MDKFKKTKKNTLFYQPEIWNKDKTIRKSHNCYSYALNIISKKQIDLCKKIQDKNGKCPIINPQPGQYAGIYDDTKKKLYNCKELVYRILSDNPHIKHIAENEKCPENYYKIALYLKNNYTDYHFYRQDDNGLWSHKDSWRKASNRDYDGKLITNIQSANRGKYTILCGFFMVPYSYKHKHISNITSKYKGWKQNDTRIKTKLDKFLISIL